MIYYFFKVTTAMDTEKFKNQSSFIFPHLFLKENCSPIETNADARIYIQHTKAL